MKRLLVLAVAGIALAGPAAAQVTIHTDTPDPYLTVLSLTQHGDRLVARDRAEATVRIEVVGADRAQLKDDADHRVAAAVAQAKQHSGITVEVGPYVVLPGRGAHPGARRGEVVASSPGAPASDWTGSQEIALSGDVDSIVALAGELQTAGLILANLRFDLAEATATAVEQEIEPQTIAALRKRAELVADAMGLRIDHIRSMTLSSASNEVNNNRQGHQPFAISIPINGAAEPRFPTEPRFAGAQGQGQIVEAGKVDVWITATAVIVLEPKPKPRQ